MDDELARRLQRSIRARYGCECELRSGAALEVDVEVTPGIAFAGSREIRASIHWKGTVLTVKLRESGSPRTVFAWEQTPSEVVTVLASRDVLTPEQAVRTWIGSRAGESS